MSEPVILQVGERRFQTSIDVLAEKSRYFRALFSGQWRPVNKQPDGSIFIDGDGKAFEHVLQYVRRGIFPIIFNHESGQHDYVLYNAILEEAKYFQCDNLVIFLEDQCYLRCVNWGTTYKIHDFESSSIDLAGGASAPRFRSFKQFQKKIYLCPRGIPGHDGNPAACGRRCENELQGYEPEYDDETVSQLLVEERRVKYHSGWMTEHGNSPNIWTRKKEPHSQPGTEKSTERTWPGEGHRSFGSWGKYGDSVIDELRYNQDG
ncbi:hypothetical protein FQN50_006807 [Emmonsiellopsis sp. PD_5]|nr:hypothetical protein FQN50_006807 [Emmonsiellopsis sp. PD_5]